MQLLTTVLLMAPLACGPALAQVDSRGDLKYNPGERLLVTDLARHDLRSMADESY